MHHFHLFAYNYFEFSKDYLDYLAYLVDNLITYEKIDGWTVIKISTLVILQKAVNVLPNPAITKIKFPLSFKNAKYSVLFTEYGSSTNPDDCSAYWVNREGGEYNDYINVCSTKSWSESPLLTIIGII